MPQVVLDGRLGKECLQLTNTEYILSNWKVGFEEIDLGQTGERSVFGISYILFAGLWLGSVSCSILWRLSKSLSRQRITCTDSWWTFRAPGNKRAHSLQHTPEGRRLAPHAPHWTRETLWQLKKALVW